MGLLDYPTSFPSCFLRYQSHDATFDPDQLSEARTWLRRFEQGQVEFPKGTLTFSRSQGPGGQHVNKTETKATSSWPVSVLTHHLPKLLHPVLRNSRYWTKGNDSITMHSQSERSRQLNADENAQKLREEVMKLYKDNIPGASTPDKSKKYEALAKASKESRLKYKKLHSSKKQSRKGNGGDF